MEIKVQFEGIFQLIYLRKNYVMAADTVKRSNLIFAESGAAKTGALEPLVQKTIFQSMEDMLKLIYFNGKELKKRRDVGYEKS